MRRKPLTAFVAAAVLLAGAEGFARFHLGLGDPPPSAVVPVGW